MLRSTSPALPLVSGYTQIALWMIRHQIVSYPSPNWSRLLAAVEGAILRLPECPDLPTPSEPEQVTLLRRVRNNLRIALTQLDGLECATPLVYARDLDGEHRPAEPEGRAALTHTLDLAETALRDWTVAVLEGGDW